MNRLLTLIEPSVAHIYGCTDLGALHNCPRQLTSFSTAMLQIWKDASPILAMRVAVRTFQVVSSASVMKASRADCVICLWKTQV